MITDIWLEEIAKAMAGDYYVIPEYMAFGTSDVTSIDTDETSVPGEIGNRVPVDSSRTVNQVTFTGIRDAGEVVDTANGDALTVASMTTSSSGDNTLQAVIVSGLTQTTNFEWEYKVVANVRRD